jgi:hypothetical protein
MNRAVPMLVLGGCLLAAPVSAPGGEGVMPTMPRQEAPSLSLPPVPHLDTIPWLTSAVDLKSRPNLDAGFKPKLDSLGPLLIDPIVPPTQFSAISGRSDSAYE